MKKTISVILLFSFLSILCGCSCKKEKDLLNIEESVLQTTYLDKPDIGRPKSQDPIDNIFISLNTLKKASYYESESTGTIEAKKSITLATQTLTNKRIITPTATFAESVSASTFIKIAEQLYITDTTVLKREASKVSDNSVSWKNNTTTLTVDDYISQYGFSYSDPSRYIINKDTIISDIEIENNGIGRKYTYKFKLDPDIAPYYYSKSVKKLSNSSTNPKFKSIEMTLTFDYKWRITKIDVKEKYEITLSALGKITCHAHLIETFKNIDKHINIQEESFFKSKL